jgi:hypothetical protein
MEKDSNCIHRRYFSMMIDESTGGQFSLFGSELLEKIPR